MRTAVIVSPQFPPSTLAGVHRARHLAKHLPRHGWRPIIVRTHEKHYAERLDPALAALVPASVEQTRTAAIPAPVARMIGVGDVGLRSFGPIRRAVAEAVRKHAADAVLITGFPFYPMLHAPWIRSRLGVPVVLDFQDPWVSADGARQRGLSKRRFSHLLACALEPRAVRGAAWITSVSDTQNAQLAARYPWFDATRMSAIPIGGDPEDFEHLRHAPPAEVSVALPEHTLNFVYVGAFLPRATEPAKALLQALATLRQRAPSLAGRMRFVFVGTSNQPVGAPVGDHRVTPLAQAAGVGDLVFEHPARVPYLEGLALMARAHALLIIGSDEPHYTASKIYPSMMAGRPYLSLFHAASSSHAILSRAGGGETLAFRDAGELSGLADDLVSALRSLAETASRYAKPDPAAYAPYSAEAVAGQFAAVFESIRAFP